MYRTVFRRILGLAFAALAVGAGGCGPGSHDVTGRVSYNGVPLDKPEGQIVFIGPAGDQVVAGIGPDGSYRALGVTGGPNKVAVYYPNPKAKRDKLTKPKPGEPPPAAAATPFLTPAKYASADTSGFSVTVGKGTVFDTDLTGPKIP
ncbi:hypothetical protein [Fimbriiglobus ruber]|uniref:Carboxypeptidase regulatory-like domain-containing protein n=1 Tax=Fimbriiglobus ruber TaxID=1908690 RepID=A0A225D9B0_9BACT|nr:hypothetical protein [Fimbriiglobus ruber]OWK38190.1 hypothetical protein FRUB_07310 [Fimbriiglobus ruber]